MEVERICSLLLITLRNAKYNESTMNNYTRLTKRFQKFCKKHGTSEYSKEIGKLYANDVINPKTGKFSVEKYRFQGRLIRLIDSYIDNGEFDLSNMKKGRVHPAQEYYNTIYVDFCKTLKKEYVNKNTQHFYDYGMYSFLVYLEANKIKLTDLKSDNITQYIRQTKPARQREVLCELRKIFRYLDRPDLLLVVKGIRAPRYKRIIPVLEDNEQERIREVAEDESVTQRDVAMVLLGLSTGIRACDLIKLRLSDIDWQNDVISWKQSKTGNWIKLPLIPSVGNALARYITEERPKAPNDFLFVRSIAPYNPLSGHSACYKVVKSILEKAGVSKNNRIFGMHMLRHNAASTMIDNGVPIETVAAILGHSNPDTTNIYIATHEERLRECVLPFGNISREIST